MHPSLHVPSLAQHELIVLYFRAHAEPTNRREKLKLLIELQPRERNLHFFENRIFFKRRSQVKFVLTDFVFFHGFSITKNSGIHKQPPSHRTPTHQHSPPNMT